MLTEKHPIPLSILDLGNVVHNHVCNISIMLWQSSLGKVQLRCCANKILSNSTFKQLYIGASDRTLKQIF